MHLGASGPIFDRVQSLREDETKAEKILWERLSKKRIGAKFRRQHPILNYIVDFYSHALKLVVELNGSVHERTKQRFHDRMRTEVLTSYGITVIRVTNEEVLSNVDQVVVAIKAQMSRMTK